MTPARRVLLDPLLDDNPITLHVLGICSALAVTTGLATALTMSLAFLAVITIASGIISALRGIIPRSARLIVQVMIMASLVIVVDQVLQAHAYEMSKRLSVFVSLIVTNCIMLARSENFALRHRVVPSMLDGFGNGLAYGAILVIMGTLRELFGAGQILGRQILPLADEGGWFSPVTLLVSPPGAFLLLGLLLWAQRAWLPGSPAAARRRALTEAHG